MALYILLSTFAETFISYFFIVRSPFKIRLNATEPATQPDEASGGAISLKLETSGCIDVPKSLTLRPAMCGLAARGYSLFLFLFHPSS